MISGWSDRVVDSISETVNLLPLFMMAPYMHSVDRKLLTDLNVCKCLKQQRAKRSEYHAGIRTACGRPIILSMRFHAFIWCKHYLSAHREAWRLMMALNTIPESLTDHNMQFRRSSQLSHHSTQSLTACRGPRLAKFAHSGQNSRKFIQNGRRQYSCRASTQSVQKGGGLRLIQHKEEAFWFYRFLSIVYDKIGE